jgi:hypothetical protein
MRQEYDFSRGGHPRHAGRLTVRERGELLQHSAVQDAQTWIISARVAVQRLEATLFSYFVLARNQLPVEAGALAASLLGGHRVTSTSSVDELRAFSSLGGDSEVRFERAVAECAWLVRRSGVESRHARSDREKTAVLLGRLDRIADDASAVQGQLEQAIHEHLLRTGFSKEEIDEMTGEAIGLWLAA